MSHATKASSDFGAGNHIGHFAPAGALFFQKSDAAGLYQSDKVGCHDHLSLFGRNIVVGMAIFNEGSKLDVSL
jgi:hypothetical protein